MAKVIEEAHEAPSLGGLMVLAFLKVHGVLEPLEMVLRHEEVFAPTYMLASMTISSTISPFVIDDNNS